MSSNEQDVIVIHEFAGKFFVWNPDHVYQLRAKHRICGALVGALPGKPYQNTQNCMPLLLLREEAHICVDEGVARLVSKQALAQAESVTNKYWSDRNDMERNQVSLFMKYKREKEEMFYGNTKFSSKKRKRKREATISDEPVNSDLDENVSEEVIPDENEIDDIITENTNDESLSPGVEHEAGVSKEADASDMDYYSNAIRVHTTLTSLRQYRVDDITIAFLNDEERTRYLVFKHFWSEGYFVTEGSKFGGDFLVYPGDPMLYHSFYVVFVKSESDELVAKDVISYGRLASSVNKTIIFAHIDSSSKVQCLSLDWSEVK